MSTTTETAYDPSIPAWRALPLTAGHPHQTARPHHQWIPLEEPTPAPVPAPVKVCSADGCEEAAVARGMCNRHYQRDYARRRRAAAAPVRELEPATPGPRESIDPVTAKLLRGAIELHPELATALLGREAPS